MADVTPATDVCFDVGKPLTVGRWIDGALIEVWDYEVGLLSIGGIGFKFEGGIITVVADAQKIRVSFDRLMTYEGDFTRVPGGRPYDIGVPALTGDTKAIDIPVTVAAPDIGEAYNQRPVTREPAKKWIG